jgi:hypothetical protein
MRAIMLDPSYAPAHAGLADFYRQRAVQDDEGAEEAWRMAEQHASQALSLDEEGAETQSPTIGWECRTAIAQTLQRFGVPEALGPIASNGKTTFDGKGHAINTFSASINGEIHRGAVASGTYIVNPDCTGTRFASDGSTYDFVVMPDGSTFSFIEVDTGTVISGSAVRFKELRNEWADRFRSENRS